MGGNVFLWGVWLLFIGVVGKYVGCWNQGLIMFVYVLVGVVVIWLMSGMILSLVDVMWYGVVVRL